MSKIKRIKCESVWNQMWPQFYHRQKVAFAHISFFIRDYGNFLNLDCSDIEINLT